MAESSRHKFESDLRPFCHMSPPPSSSSLYLSNKAQNILELFSLSLNCQSLGEHFFFLINKMYILWLQRIQVFTDDDLDLRGLSQFSSDWLSLGNKAFKQQLGGFCAHNQLCTWVDHMKDNHSLWHHRDPIVEKKFYYIVVYTRLKCGKLQQVTCQYTVFLS